MRQFHRVVVVVGLVAMGCQDPGSQGTLVAVAHNDLGITQAEIERTSDGENRVLIIRGLDDSGEEVATATVETGVVYYTYDQVAAGQLTAGSSLEFTWSASGESVSYVVPSTFPKQLKEPALPSLASFAHLTVVAAEIARDGGFSFEATPPLLTGRQLAGEQAYFTDLCPTGYFNDSYFTPYCCHNENDLTIHKDGERLLIREYSFPCANSNGTIGCGTDVGTMCYFGPCYGHTSQTMNGASPIVFNPTGTFYEMCGYDTESGGAGQVWPEEYNGSQTPYASTQGSCPYTSCTSDGVRH